MNYQRAVAEIDLSALDFNIKSIFKKIPKETGIIGVIKADAYGHGSVEVAKILKENGVGIFSVAFLDEAIHLRKNNITEPILILGYVPKDYIKEALENNVIFTVSSLVECENISSEASKMGKTALVHIKIDTGMCRLGFVPSPKAVLEILEINKLPNLQIDGVFTHFATSDEVDKTFTMEQKNKFVNMVTDLENKGVTFNKKHCSNSGAIMDFDNLCFNFVRAGIILYGLYPSDDVKKENLEIKPVMTVRARIVHIKEVEENTTIGYGRTFTTTAKRKIATVCLGYADGLPRALSNKGFLWLHNKRVPIVGRVCMDLCMVDVTEVENVTMEEEITFFGQVFSANEVGKMCGTIGYEVVCAISKRVPRIYKKN